MTKQVFDQIAEGLREAAETPPAWAMEKAQTILLERMVQYDHMLVGAIARALAEADKAATERAAKIGYVTCASKHHVTLGRDVEKNILAGDLSAAIRGAGHE